MPKTQKKPKNLSLPADAIARGERYSSAHDTNLSRLVGDYLRSLPLASDDRIRSPLVARLRGVAKGGSSDRATYRTHLTKKYRGR